MRSLASLISLACACAAIVSATPTPTQVEKRATTCTFTDAAAVTESKTSCSSIVLQNIAVPGGETLDLTDLNDGTHVCDRGQQILKRMLPKTRQYSP